MEASLIQIIEQLDQRPAQASKERQRDGLARLAKGKIQIPGQMSLFTATNKIRQSLRLAMANDFNAIIEGDWSLRTFLKEVLAQHHIEYDDLKREIWISPGSSFWEVYESDNLGVTALNPESCLLFKAIKAPGKNYILIRNALAYYGD